MKMGNMIKTVCVFSSSSSAVNSVYRDTATDLGKRLGQESFDLIFGGADELIISNNLRDRKEIIESKSDAFIALPGAP